MKKYLPRPIKYLLISIYVFVRCLVRGKATGLRLNLAGVLPSEPKAIIHGGKVKLLALKERFGDSWKNFNIAYFASSGLPFAPAIWLKLYKMFGVKTVWNQNGVAYPALYSPEIVKRINDLYKSIGLCDYIIYQTEFTKHCTEKLIGHFSINSEVLINPVDTKRFHPAESPVPDEPLVIIMSGNHFESRERWDVAIEAIRSIRAQGIATKLLLIGHPDFEINEEWIEKVGPFTQEKAPALYRRAHLLLHLKYLDPCPTIVLEALATGLPVVGQKNGGMPELVESAGRLLQVPEDFEKLRYPSVQEVAQAILQVRGDLRELSRVAHERALMFDKEKWVKRHEEIFKNLCQ